MDGNREEDSHSFTSIPSCEKLIISKLLFLANIFFDLQKIIWQKKKTICFASTKRIKNRVLSTSTQTHPNPGHFSWFASQLFLMREASSKRDCLCVCVSVCLSVRPYVTLFTYLIGPYYAGPNLTPALITPALITPVPKS